MTSLWLDRAPHIETDGFESGQRFDEVVVGAGITGLVAALLFARAGRRVAVVEARRVGAVSTGNTTAKLSVLQGARHRQGDRAAGPQSHGYRPAVRDPRAVVLPGQAQFDPMDVLATLAADVRSHGGRIFEGVRVQRAKPDDPVTVVQDLEA